MVSVREQIAVLREFVTQRRWDLFQHVLQYRTRYITVVLEDIYQPHNASAVLRSCDCFGVQDVHIIENRNKYRVNPEVSMGSHKWLSLKRYQGKDASIKAIETLRSLGYRIVATTPHTDDVSLEDFDLRKGKIALFFGTELEGLTQEVLDNADEYLKIPMYGFTESFNISVSVAIILHHLTWKLRDSDLPWQLGDAEKELILLDWLKQSVRGSEQILKRLENG